MTPVLICESPYNVEYFVFEFYGSKGAGTLQCVGNYSASWWRYLLIGVSSLGEKVFHCFHTDEELIKYLTPKRVVLDSIRTRKGRDTKLKRALQKHIGYLPPMSINDAYALSKI